MNKYFAIALLFLSLFLMAADPAYPDHGAVYRKTVLTTAQTEIILPTSHVALETTIINKGTGRLYVKFESGTINTSTDFYLESGDTLPRVNIPWNTIEMLATSTSAECELVVSY
jgi:hypothetical protein